MQLTEAQTANLVTIVETAVTSQGSQFAYFHPSRIKPLIDNNLVIGNPQMMGDGNTMAYRATDAGMEYYNNMNTQGTPVPAAPMATAAVATETKPQIVLETGYIVPPSKRTPAPDEYPFDQMQPGHSFAVPVTDDTTVEKMHSRFSAMLSRVNKRYGQIQGKKPKRFKSRDEAGNIVVDENGDTVYETRQVDNWVYPEKKLRHRVIKEGETNNGKVEQFDGVRVFCEAGSAPDDDGDE